MASSSSADRLAPILERMGSTRPLATKMNGLWTATASDPLNEIEVKFYVLPNMLLKDVRSTDLFDLHGSSADGEPRIRGAAADQWFARFDVPPEELLAYKAKLLDEPKLTKETTLPNRI